MRSLVIGDVHFGCRSNNTSWLDMQLDFFYKQVIPTIKSDNFDNIIFLGDVFDIRYSINQLVGICVKELFRELANISKEIYIVAGNHDYYSPLVDFQKYNSYSLIFGEEFTDVYKNIHFITNEPLKVDNYLMLPWYYTEDINLFKSAIENNPNINTIFCHSDLSTWKEDFLNLINNVTVYAGHIHYPWQDTNKKLYNLGACCAFNFNDANQTRCLYILENGKIIDTIENNTTPLFKRFYNNEIFTLSEDDFKNSIIQLCISQKNVNKARYIEQIKELKTTYVNSNFKVNVIDDEFIDKIDGIKFTTNIEQYIENNIPENLTSKYQLIKEQLKNTTKE